ncbi:MAG: hypothetical protein WCJ19_06000 [bacterium]
MKTILPTLALTLFSIANVSFAADIIKGEASPFIISAAKLTFAMLNSVKASVGRIVFMLMFL